MANTERTTAQINSLLADNTSGDVSPQDLRDAIASIFGGYGGLLLSLSGSPVIKSDVAQTPLIITEYDHVEAQSSDVNSSGVVVSAAAGTITIGQSGIYMIHFSVSFSLSSPNTLASFRLYTNSVVGDVGVDRFIGGASQSASANFVAMLTLTAGDILDIRAFIDSGTASITFTNVGFLLHRVG